MARGKKSTDGKAELDQLRDLVETEPDGETTAAPPTSRRGLLKMAGAALAGAAGVAALKVMPAAATTGAAILQGCYSFETANQPTFVYMAGGSPSAEIGAPFIGHSSTGLRGEGYYTTNHKAEIGVLGVSKSGQGIGVLGGSTSGPGVSGTSSSGTGGLFYSATGYDVEAGFSTNTGQVGTGRISQVGRTDTGGSAPPFSPFFAVFTSDFFQHEVVRGNDGSMWASTAATTGTSQSRWRRVNTVRTDTADGVGGVYKPFRLLDTRSGAIKAAGSVTSVPTAGHGTGASAIPADAIAVMGNLTAAGYTGGGFLTIMPNGIVIGTGVGQYNPSSDPSSVNFIVGQYAIANSFVCGLSGGALQVYVGGPPLPGHSSHFIIDITAYLQ